MYLGFEATFLHWLSHELFHPLEWLNSNFSLQYLVWITYKGHKNKGNEDQLKKLLIVKQILLVSIFRNVLWTVLRICILILVSNALGLEYSIDFDLNFLIKTGWILKPTWFWFFVNRLRILQLLRNAFLNTPRSLLVPLSWHKETCTVIFDMIK